MSDILSDSSSIVRADITSNICSDSSSITRADSNSHICSDSSSITRADSNSNICSDRVSNGDAHRHAHGTTDHDTHIKLAKLHTHVPTRDVFPNGNPAYDVFGQQRLR